MIVIHTTYKNGFCCKSFCSLELNKNPTWMKALLHTAASTRLLPDLYQLTGAFWMCVCELKSDRSRIMANCSSKHSVSLQWVQVFCTEKTSVCPSWLSSQNREYTECVCRKKAHHVRMDWILVTAGKV